MSNQPSRKEASYFYVPGQLNVIDQVVKTDDGKEYGLYGRRTRQEIEAKHPGVVVVSTSEFRAQANAAARTPPSEITQEEFDHLLNVLPPKGWVRGHESESFKLVEYYAYDVTTIAARVGDRYFMFHDLGSMPHIQIVETVRASEAFAVGVGEDMRDRDDAQESSPAP